MDRKPNVEEFFILGPSLARMALSRVARQRMVGSAITTTTPESRTDKHKETCTGTSERKSLSCCQVRLSPDSMCSLSHFSDFLFFLAVSRPDSGNCRERDGECTDNTSPYAHTRTLSRCAPTHARCDHTFGSMGFTICLCASKIISSLVMSLLNVPSTPLPPIFSSPTASPTPLTGIRVNPCATPLWGGPSGHLACPIPDTKGSSKVVIGTEEQSCHIAVDLCSQSETSTRQRLPALHGKLCTMSLASTGQADTGCFAPDQFDDRARALMRKLQSDMVHPVVGGRDVLGGGIHCENSRG